MDPATVFRWADTHNLQTQKTRTDNRVKVTRDEQAAIFERLENGEPQAQVAADFGVSQQHVSRIAAGVHPESHTVQGVARDSHGRIKRSEAAKRDFMKSTGFLHGRPGFVLDHIKPLKEGGCDCPANIQWQTKADAKAKEKWE